MNPSTDVHNMHQCFTNSGEWGSVEEKDVFFSPRKFAESLLRKVFRHTNVLI